MGAGTGANHDPDATRRLLDPGSETHLRSPTVSQSPAETMLVGRDETNLQASPRPASDFLAQQPLHHPHQAWHWWAPAVVAALAVGAVAGYRLHSSAPSPPAQSPPATATVRSVNASLAPGRLTCPSATAVLSAHVVLSSGGATLTYNWVLPDGTTTAPQKLTLSAGQTSAEVSLREALTGTAPLSGDAVFHLLAPADGYSAPIPVKYTCP